MTTTFFIFYWVYLMFYVHSVEAIIRLFTGLIIASTQVIYTPEQAQESKKEEK